jgi:copper chaperone
MIAFRVDDMTCGHCASAITKAVRAVDIGAKVEVDLVQRLVRIESTETDARHLGEAITKAGYTPVPVEVQPVSAAVPRAGGCCCSGKRRGS